MKPYWIIVEHGGTAHAVNGTFPGEGYHTYCGLRMAVTRPAFKKDRRCKVCRKWTAKISRRMSVRRA